MDALERLKETNNPAIIITDYDDSLRILKALHKQSTIRAMRFVTEKDLFNKVFFRFGPSAIYEAAKFLNKSPDVVEPMLDFLYKIDIDAVYESKKLRTLQGLKVHLEKKGALEKSAHRALWFKNHDLLITNPIFDPFIKDAVKTLEKSISVIKTYEPVQPSVFTYLEHASIEDEVLDTAIRILKRKEEGVPFEHMAVLNAHKAYIPKIKTLFNFLDIPFELRKPKPLFDYPVTQDFLSRLKETNDPDPYAAFKEVLFSMKENVHSSEKGELIQEITRAVNPLVKFITSLHEDVSFIEYTLKNTYKKMPIYENTVKILSVSAASPKAFFHVFVVGLHEGYAPTYKESDDYLSEAEKKEIEVPDVLSINASRKKEILESLPRFEHVHLSLSSSSAFDTYQKAAILKTLKETHTFKEVAPESFKDQTYSEAIDVLRTKALLDAYTLYDDFNSDLETLYPMFKDEIKPHDPSFKGLSKDVVDALHGKKASVSTTQIDAYGECKFRFLLEHVLKIDRVDNPFNMDLGTFFHDVLEHTLAKEEVSDEILEKILEKVLERSGYPYSDFDLFYFKKAYPFIRLAHTEIRVQQETTNYLHGKSEEKIEHTFNLSRDVTFKGKIDKVMTKDDLFYLIDYKTGKKTLDLPMAKYGRKVQLLYYVLLYQYKYPDSEPTGFFEQTVYPDTPKRQLNKTKLDQYKETLKLKGYVIDNMALASDIDPNLQIDSFIRGLSIKKDGTFAKRTKRFTKEDLGNLKIHVEKTLETMLEGIASGDFEINPKQDQNRTPLSCTYCPFADICYKRAEDYVTQSIDKNSDELFKALKEDA